MKGDRVAEVAGKSVSSVKDFTQALAIVRAGESVELAVERAGVTKKITIIAGEGL
jgi:S1-C subfamily serine protease